MKKDTIPEWKIGLGGLLVVGILLTITVIYANGIHFYKHGAVTRLVEENQALLNQAVVELVQLESESENCTLWRYLDSTPIKGPLVLRYVATTDGDPIYPESWKDLSYAELVQEHGKEYVDLIIPYEDFSGSYLCYEGQGNSDLCYYFPLENPTLLKVLEEMDVQSIVVSEGLLNFICFERFRNTYYENVGFYYIPEGTPATSMAHLDWTEQTDRTWLYHSEYCMHYYERISGDYYYYDEDGEDPV